MICGENASKTFEEFVEFIGPLDVHNLGITLKGLNVVCNSLAELKDVYRAQAKNHVLSNGMFLFTYMSTDTKISIILDISRRFKIDVKIEYV